MDFSPKPAMLKQRDVNCEGLYCYLATPFDAAGNVDEGVLDAYVSEMLTFGVDGVTCLASTCEGPYLTGSEWNLVLQRVGKIANGRAKLNVGVGAFSTRQTIEQAKKARDVGATSLMIELPQYFSIEFEDAYRHYATIAEEVDVPIRLYNLAVTTRFDFTPDRIRRMAEVAQITSVKEASGDVSRLGQIRALCGDRFKLFCGFHFQGLEGMRLGADGWEVMMHPLIASQITDLYRSLREDPYSQASAEKFNALAPLFEFFRKKGVPQTIKEMSARTDLPLGIMRQPIRVLTNSEKAELNEVLINCGIFG